MPIVRMPTGELVNMPDNPTPQQLQALQRVTAKAAEPPGIGEALKQFGHEAWDWTKNLGTAAYKGLADLPAGAADAFAGSYDAQDAIGAAMGVKPRELHPGAVTAALNDTGYKPKTKAQEVGQNIVRAAAGAALAPGNLTSAAGNTTKAIAGALVKQAAKAGAVGAASGAAAETAGLATDNPYARLAAGTLGGIAAGTVQGIAASRNAGHLARRALKDVDPRHLKTAQDNMRLAEAEGVPVNLSQAMPEASNIDSIVETLANNSFGQNVTRQLRNQPRDISMRLEQEFAGLPGEIAPSPQGPANAVNAAATRFVQNAKDQRQTLWKNALDSGTAEQQLAADKALLGARQHQAAMKARLEQAQAIEAAKQPPAPGTAIPTGVGATPEGILLNDAGRGDAAMTAIAAQEGKNSLASGQGVILGADGKPLATPPRPGSLAAFGDDLASANEGVKRAQANADSVGSVAPKAVSKLYQTLTNEADARRNSELGKMILEMRDKLHVEGEWLTDANELNTILKETSTRLKDPTLSSKGLDSGATNYMRGLVAKARNTLGEAFEPIKAANAAYQEATQNLVNPAKNSVTGRMATPRGALPDVEASTAKLKALFDNGTTPGAKTSEILALARDLKTVEGGREAFQGAAKTWLAERLSNIQAPVDNRNPAGIAKRFVAMFGNGVQATKGSQGLRDMLAGMAHTQGVPAATYVKGVENFSKVIGMAARRPAVVQGVNEAALDAIASGNPVSVAGRTRTGLFGNLAMRWNEALRADAYREMDRLLTSSEGVDMLKKLAAGNPKDPKLQAIVNTYLGTQADLHADEYGK